MTRRLTPAAALMAAAALFLLAWAFRHEIEQALLGAACFAFGYRILRQRLIPSAKRGGRRRGLVEAAAAAMIGLWAGRASRRTHPCGQCGHPIGAPSRAVYCSPACRRYAALERAEVERRARALEGWGDVPY